MKEYALLLIAFALMWQPYAEDRYKHKRLDDCADMVYLESKYINGDDYFERYAELVAKYDVPMMPMSSSEAEYVCARIGK